MGRRYALDALWCPGVVVAPVEHFLDESFRPRVAWIDCAPWWQYFADPFGIETDDGVLVVCEAYDYRRRRGELVSFHVDELGRAGRVSVCMRGAEHLSFPSLAMIGGRRWLVPAALARRSIVAYPVDLAPGLTLGSPTVLVAGVEAHDPIVFEHDGLVWIFATDAVHRLSIWFATTMTGPFSLLPSSGLGTLPGGARSAGPPFRHDGRLFRPVQDASDGYGSGVVLAEILELSPSSFEERPIRRLDALDERFPLGFHTLSSAGRFTLVDGRRASNVPPVARAAVGYLAASLRG
jgi:hypothetical protein